MYGESSGGEFSEIAGIRVTPDEVTFEPCRMMSALAAAWQPTFAEKAIDLAAATEFAQSFSSKFDFTECSPPSSASISRFLVRARDSGPGNDGIPYAGYAKCMDICVPILFDVSVWLRSGQLMMDDFSCMLKIFIHKNKEGEDDKHIFRSPECTRPLGLKNYGQQKSDLRDEQLHQVLCRSWCLSPTAWLPTMSKLCGTYC